jgi:hypothetical protein
VPKDPKKIQRNKQILKDNKNLNFVKRINNPLQSIPDINGDPMTHYMTSEDNRVFPQVIQNNTGELQYLPYNEASSYARQSGEYIELPSMQDATDYGKTYKEGTPLEEFKNGGKMKKSKIKKKKVKGPVSLEFPPVQYNMGGKLYSVGGNFAGNLGTEGVQNNNMNKEHMYFNSTDKFMIGLGTGVAGAFGLSGLADSAINNVDTYGQLRKSKEFGTGAGVGSAFGGLSSAAMGVGMGQIGKKQNSMESPNTNIQDPGFVTPELQPDNTSVEVTGLNNSGPNVWNAYGGPLKHSQSSALHSLKHKVYKNNNYNLDSLQELPKSNSGYFPDGGQLPYGTYYNSNNQPKEFMEPNFAHAIAPVQRSYVPALQQYKEKLNSQNAPLRTAPVNFPQAVNRKDYAAGGWIPPVDQLINEQPNLVADAQLTYGNDWYNILKQEDAKSPIFDQSTYDPTNLYTRNAAKRFEGFMLDKRTNPDLPWKTFNNPLSSDEGMLEGQKTKIKRNTNQVDTQEGTYSKHQKFHAMGGELGLSEANGGFMHEDPNMNNVNQGVPINNQATVEVGETIFNPENYVFSDRIKIPGSKYTYADVSKKIKNKFKLRPEDKLSKEAITQDLTKLMNEQEAVKKAKAQSLMQKAIELDPAMLQQMQQPQEQQVSPEQQMMMGEPQMGFGGKVPSAKGALGNIRADKEYNESMKYLTAPQPTNRVDLVANPQYPVDKKVKKFPNGGEFENLEGYVEPDYGFTDPNAVIGLNQKQHLDPFANYNPTTNPPQEQPLFRDHTNPLLRLQNNTDNTDNNTNNTRVDSGPLPGETAEEYKVRVLNNTKMPMDYSGINAAGYGLQALGEGLRLATTPNSKLAGNVNFDRVNPYAQEVIARKQAQEAQAGLLSAYRNSGINPSSYIAAATGAIGDIGAKTGLGIAGINNQGQMTNAQIQSQEAQINKNLELQRNEIQAQDTANRSNQLGAVGAGLVQNMSTMYKDKSARDTDLYAMEFMDKNNHKLINTPEEAEMYGAKIGQTIFVPTGFKTKELKIKKKYKKKTD